ALVNQRSPSEPGPLVMPYGDSMPGPEKLDTPPDVEIRPTESFPELVNQSAPSEPSVMSVGRSMPAPPKRAIFPFGLMRPMVFPPVLVNQTSLPACTRSVG